MFWNCARLFNENSTSSKTFCGEDNLTPCCFCTFNNIPLAILSSVSGIKKDIESIKNPNILENFLKILAQEETKLSKLKTENAASH